MKLPRERVRFLYGDMGWTDGKRFRKVAKARTLY